MKTSGFFLEILIIDSDKLRCVFFPCKHPFLKGHISKFHFGYIKALLSAFFSLLRIKLNHV